MVVQDAGSRGKPLEGKRQVAVVVAVVAAIAAAAAVPVAAAAATRAAIVEAGLLRKVPGKYWIRFFGQRNEQVRVVLAKRCA